MRRPILEGATPTFAHGNGHILIGGASGTGKSVFQIALILAKLRDPTTGVIVIDPEGEISPILAEHLANPLNGLSERVVHYLDPASATEAFSLPLLHVPDRDPVACHKMAVRALAILEQAVNFGMGEYGPRLTKLLYLGLLALALTGRPLADIADVYTRGSEELRASLASALPYEFLRDELVTLDMLSARAFVEYRDSLVSRLMPIFGNAQLRRVFSGTSPVDIRRVMRNREVVLLPLGRLEHKDAVLVGKALFSILYHAALEREPGAEPHCFVSIDEAFDYLSLDLARGFDRLRKRNIQLAIAIQRFAQLAGKADTEAVGLLSAVVSGTRTKLAFRFEDPDDCDFVARALFLGHVPLSDWKPGSERPVVVGHEVVTLKSRSRGTTWAEHEATATTDGIAEGTAQSVIASTTDGVTEGTSSGTTRGRSDGTGSADALSSADSSFAASSQNLGFDPLAYGAILPPTGPISFGQGTSSGHGSASGASHVDQRSSSTTQAQSEASSRSSSRALSEAHALTSSHVTSHALSHMQGTTHGGSESEGESEALRPVIEWLPSQLYSLEEQLHRLAGEVKSLPLRHCFLKVDEAPPVRARTADLPPAFRSAAFREVMLGLYRQRLLESPYLFPIPAAEAVEAPTPEAQPEPAFAPEPLPAPHSDLVESWKQLRRTGPGRREKSPPPRPRPPFEVIEGGRPGDNPGGEGDA